MHRDVASYHRRLPVVKHAHRRAIWHKVSHRVCERRAAAIDEDLDHRTIDIHPNLHRDAVRATSRRSKPGKRRLSWFYSEGFQITDDGLLGFLRASYVQRLALKDSHGWHNVLASGRMHRFALVTEWLVPAPSCAQTLRLRLRKTGHCGFSAAAVHWMGSAATAAAVEATSRAPSAAASMAQHSQGAATVTRSSVHQRDCTLCSYCVISNGALMHVLQVLVYSS